MRFKEWCTANGYTAKKIAELTGISFRTIWAYYQGVRTPTRKNEAVLKEKLGLPSGLFDK